MRKIYVILFCMLIFIRTIPAQAEGGLRELEQGKNAILYESQARLLEDEYYQFFLEGSHTIVIAVDRAMTTVQIESFSDIFEIEEEITLDLGERIEENMWEYPKTHHILLAMAEALYGSYDVQALSIDLAKIEAEGRLYLCDLDKAVLITYDSVVNQLIEEGRDFEIIYPLEGVFTINYGMLSYAEHKLEQGMSEEELEVFRAYNRAASQVATSLMRETFDTERYSFAGPKEITTIYLAFLFALILYFINLRYRITDKKILNALLFAICLQIFFLSMGVLKSIANESVSLEISIWYAYYIPILMLPGVLVYITFHMGKVMQKGIFIILFRAYTVVSTALLLLVMTNNYHELVFDVTVYSKSWYEYEYMLVYYVVIVWVLTSFVVAVSALIVKAFQSPKKSAFLYPVLVNVLLIIYIISYIVGLPIVREFELSFGNTMILFLYIEACLRSSLFPNNKGYEKLFAHSSLAMKITNQAGEVVENSKVSREIDHNYQLREADIHGGRFSYFEDYTTLNHSLERLADLNEVLRENNEFLLQVGEINADIAATVAEQKVYERVDEILVIGIAKLKQELQCLEVGKINLLICLLKRKCMMSINALYQEKQHVGIFLNAITELKEYIPKAKWTVRNTIQYPMKTSDLCSMYQMLSFLIEQGIDSGFSFAFVQLYEEKEYILFSVILDTLVVSEQELEEFAYQNVLTISLKPWENGYSYLMRVSKKEDEYVPTLFLS